MTNTTTQASGSVAQKALNFPMRDLVRAVLHFTFDGEATLDQIRTLIGHRFDDELPRRWKTQVRDVLKHDPEIEKAADDAWVLRTPDSTEA
jgi:hypothetical protein